MALIAVDAVVHVPGHLRVTEVVGVVAAVASSALKDCVVVGVDVAGRAHIVRTAVVGRELRVLCVVKGRVQPAACAVAVLARCGEELRLRCMTRIGRVVVVGLMTSDARGWQRGVIAVDVAIAALARRRSVRTCERKGCVVVIKG